MDEKPSSQTKDQEELERINRLNADYYFGEEY